ncbi:bifunctional adenosylcobinamide kinase/adenosylcobinamide-phosphate guanylyltransferase [Clostridium bornimense]|uniref:bifunctional adenosylcobinamide kinase/adenosylcobinamide-phosphate guanylyltransferase n=1 Tax=Clostridium bornimense TaxID=1216932 RepID=UPI001C11EFEA|nr:bifunctional adenosylcobinamide kinase/adenosylcobinamide-phosphate guanylyltransferase [Clostridium bornimense]MBU5315317.1 bifunctional adenosylcobinamide kinase/adenosylcobinamide-phosphate guanylyltransferase [Clostridium bornimense]
MILIIGGAYNGKLNFAQEHFNILKEDICFCNENKIDLSKKVICEFQKYVYFRVRSGHNVVDEINHNKERLEDKIIICDDISSGIVPLKEEERMWREELGRCLQLLSKEAKCIYRVFCGIPILIKNEEL